MIAKRFVDLYFSKLSFGCNSTAYICFFRESCIFYMNKCILKNVTTYHLLYFTLTFSKSIYHRWTCEFSFLIDKEAYISILCFFNFIGFFFVTLIFLKPQKHKNLSKKCMYCPLVKATTQPPSPVPPNGSIVTNRGTHVAWKNIFYSRFQTSRLNFGRKKNNKSFKHLQVRHEGLSIVCTKASMYWDGLTKVKVSYTHWPPHRQVRLEGGWTFPRNQPLHAWLADFKPSENNLNLVLPLDLCS